MKKKFALCLAAVLLLSGCGKKQEITMDLNEVSVAILGEDFFEEELFEVEKDVASKVLGIPEDYDGEVYMGTAATAEELVLLKAEDETSAGELKDALSQHLADRTEQYSVYLPDEAFKLESAILEQYGTYVVLCVANDNAGVEKVLKTFTE